MKSLTNFISRIQPATVAIISFLYFVIAATALYFLNPEYNLIRSFIGYYDFGSNEFLIASTFFSVGLGSLALVFGLYKGMAQSVRSRTGLLLLSIWGVGMLIAGIFPANEGSGTIPQMTTVLLAGLFPIEIVASPETIFSFIHIIALGVSFLILTIGSILLLPGIKEDEKLRLIHSMALILSAMMCVASILFYLTSIFPRFVGSANYGPIVFIFTGFVISMIWLFLVAIRLRFFVNLPVSK